MKKILLLLSLVLTFTTTHAQSDATIEETIDWINTFAFQKAYDINSHNKRHYSIFYIEEYSELQLRKQDEEYDNLEYEKIPIKSFVKLRTSVRGDGSYFIALYFTKQSSGNSTYFFSLPDKKITERTFKALKHLFKLLNHNLVIKDTLSIENKF